jgi:hypothetical protein
LTVPQPSNIDRSTTLPNLATTPMADNTNLPTTSQDAKALPQNVPVVKFKFNMVLLQQKLQEAKALAGKNVGTDHSPITTIVANEAKETEHTTNQAVHEPSVSAHPQV